MPLDEEIEHDDHDIRQNLPKLSGNHNKQLLFSREVLLMKTNVAPRGNSIVAVPQVPSHKQRETNYDRDYPVEDVEEREKLLDEDYFIAHKSKIEVYCKTGCPQE